MLVAVQSGLVQTAEPQAISDLFQSDGDGTESIIGDQIDALVDAGSQFAYPAVPEGELITNGDFPTDATGWTGENATLAVASGELQVPNLAGTVVAQARQAITTTIGEYYTLTAKVRVIDAATAKIGVGTALGLVDIVDGDVISAATLTPVSYSFIAEGTTTHITLFNTDVTIALIAQFDDVSVMVSGESAYGGRYCNGVKTVDEA